MHFEHEKHVFFVDAFVLRYVDFCVFFCDASCVVLKKFAVNLILFLPRCSVLRARKCQEMCAYLDIEAH